MQAIRLSYAELLRQVDGVARGLLALGVRRQDRVAIWAPNCAEWIVLGWAAAQIGAILVNINPAFRSEGESVLECLISFALVFTCGACMHRPCLHGVLPPDCGSTRTRLPPALCCMQSLHML